MSCVITRTNATTTKSRLPLLMVSRCFLNTSQSNNPIYKTVHQTTNKLSSYMSLLGPPQTHFLVPDLKRYSWLYVISKTI